MVGITKAERDWQWAAYGKHSSIKDHLRLGQYFPMGRSFSEWMAAGYEMFADRGNPVQQPCSWLFWTREARRENVVCGLVKDSADSTGRPYPLLLIGSGPLEGWGNCWDLVPLALQSVWSQMDRLSTVPLADVTKLEDELLSIRPPAEEWTTLEKRRKGLPELDPAILADLEKRAVSLFDKPDCFVPTEQQSDLDHLALIVRCHYSLKVRTENVPSAVFMRRNTDTSYVAFYKRPLLSSDFVNLWSLGNSRA